MAAIAVVVKLTSPGPVFFKQTRCGAGGREFTCLKFRTMVDNADAVLASDPALYEEFKDSWKLQNDPRITPVGDWLRKTSLDELPQLLNVAAGDMSIVGPRPVRPDELESKFGSAADIVVSVKPGITGLWQVSGRSSLTYEERVELDVRYVRSLGLWEDLKILFLTVPAVLTRKGAV